jgi:hypothetical protein
MVPRLTNYSNRSLTRSPRRSSDDQPKDIPALLDYRHPPMGTTTRNTIHASSRLLLPVLAENQK